jgi:Concanavalin A-like lectin/glucanases superfamily
MKKEVRILLTEGALIVVTCLPVFALDNPVACWSFDGLAAMDAIGSFTNRIEGNFKFMPEGVRNGCLRFDGFTTAVRQEASRVPNIENGFTLQGWVAMAAYPWAWSPILAQRQGDTQGFSFGIDSTGRVGLQVAVGVGWTNCSSSQVLKLRQWTHVAATHDPMFGVQLFLDGESAGTFPVSQKIILAKGSDLLIGRNHEKMVPAHLVREWAKFPSWWSFDGLMDEVRMYDRVLSAKEIRDIRLAEKPATPPLIEQRRFPDVSRGSNRFGAYPTRLNYYEQWDALWQMAGEPDIVVKFDELPVKMVFWRGTRYSPCWVTENGKWMADQSLETGVWPDKLKKRNGQGAVGCCEHMSDTECRFSHVRILENTDARVVIHWRYAMVDAALQFEDYDEVSGQGQYGDEFYYIYPDGIATRDVHGWWPESAHQVDQETIFLNEDGTKPEDNCEVDAVSLANLQGKTETYSWKDGVPVMGLKEPVIQMVNLKSRFRPLIITKPGSVIKSFNGEIRKDFSFFPWWNHWPVARIASDGRYAMAPDRASHSSLTWVIQKSNALLYGMSDKPITENMTLARSWITPSAIKIRGDNCSSSGYIPDQRAYILKKETPGGKLEIELAGSSESPVLNPALVIIGWGEQDATLKLDGMEVQRGRAFRYGHRRSLEGTDLIVWIKTQREKTVKIVIRSVSEER